MCTPSLTRQQLCAALTISESILIASGADLFTVSKILGHASVKTTERYAHLELAQQRKAMLKAFK